MREIKREKRAKIIHRLAARFVEDIASPASLITITRAELSLTGKEAKIFFTTLPADRQETAEKFLVRKTPEFKRYLKNHSSIGLIPQLTFEIDLGERSRQRMDELSKEK